MTKPFTWPEAWSGISDLSKQRSGYQVESRHLKPNVGASPRDFQSAQVATVTVTRGIMRLQSRISVNSLALRLIGQALLEDQNLWPLK